MCTRYRVLALLGMYMEVSMMGKCCLGVWSLMVATFMSVKHRVVGYALSSFANVYVAALLCRLARRLLM